MLLNLWKETRKTLKENNLKWKDVEEIGTSEGYIIKEDFKEYSKNFNYKSDYSGPYVDPDLIIKGKNFILIRGEYDGSEWWDCIKLDTIVNTNKKIEKEKLEIMFKSPIVEKKMNRSDKNE